MTGASILSSTYGIEIQRENDPYVDIGERALHAIACAGNAGAYLVDTFPIRTSTQPDFSGGGISSERNNSQARAPVVSWSWISNPSQGMAKVSSRYAGASI